MAYTISPSEITMVLAAQDSSEAAAYTDSGCRDAGEHAGVGGSAQSARAGGPRARPIHWPPQRSAPSPGANH
eukprot:COSAG06_NODE_360_length_16832_cov_9.250209_12_plen_72_part_00